VYSIQTICTVVEGHFISTNADDEIEHLVYDSRRLPQAPTSLFFALKTENNNGHKYLADAYKKGVRNFIVSEDVSALALPQSNIIVTNDTLQALQKIASFHRKHFQIPVIGITGSNGKTIVKEWLYHLLQDAYNIVRSPKSFNSQIGVPLSVWQMNARHSLGIFEAGISTTGEMAPLREVIRPTIGIFTNIGEAHDAGFTSREQKFGEKMKLFDGVEVLIGQYELVSKAKPGQPLFSWSKTVEADLQILSVKKKYGVTTIEGKRQGQVLSIRIPFTDDASVENAINCWCTVLYLGKYNDTVKERFSLLHAVDMRLQLKHGINDCLVVNDSYSADTTSLKIALDFLEQQSSGLKRTVILSDFFETGKSKKDLYAEIAELLRASRIHRVITVGAEIGKEMAPLLHSVKIQSYPSTDDLILDFKSSSFFNEIILIKGARKYEFERVAQLFERKLHQTVLEINLNALVHNLKEYQRLLKPGTKVMAMVKAFSYGSGGAEIASVLQFHNVDYLGVAYADEGVELMKAGISLPVMVMNAEESSFQAIVDYSLQPVIYSFHLLRAFESYLKDQGLQSYPVHLEIETGMNRLGFALSEVEEVARHIADKSVLRVQSVFSHLAASEDPLQDSFTLQQKEVFDQAVHIIKEYISYPFLRHISNTAAVVRHPQLQLDMVRLGIGLYGVEVDGQEQLDLQAVATLRSTIAQLKHIRKGESVSYNRRGVVDRDSVIATIRVGYADGFSRQFSNGVGWMLVKGHLAPVIGSVCMDMTMIDVTDIADVKEGDDVVIFGSALTVQQVAAWIRTIPYEVMTGVSQRVKRIYFHE
jgi:alanine racemase